jgi:hypothetical protein
MAGVEVGVWVGISVGDPVRLGVEDGEDEIPKA